MRKVAIVTGTSRGIGREIALELASSKYDIIGTYNTNLADIKKLQLEIESTGADFKYYKLDLTDEKEIDSFCKAIKENYSNIDILVNNAGLSLDNEFDLKTSKEFIDVLKVNLIGPFLLIQKLYSIMNDGVIINIASTDGINTYTKYNIDYSASKAALINLTKSLSLILNDINVYAICPNWVDTESVREMNFEYLNEEMKRINQKELIDPKKIAKKVIEIINSNIESGSIIVMEDNNE